MATLDDHDMPVVWRTKLRTEIPGIDHAQQVAYCLTNSLIGTGWGLEQLPDGAPYTDVIQAVEQMTGPRWGSAAQMVRSFGKGAQLGDFVWTRDTAGHYLLCRITGDYRYFATAAACLSSGAPLVAVRKTGRDL